MDSIVTLLTGSLAALKDTLIGFAVEVFLATLIFLHYRRYGSSMSSKQSFGPVLPFVALTTFLVISAVKSSFALSLGLVGALSIVRFRTPVKDPEELGYIFLTIASGIGTAAGQNMLTLTIVPLILLVKTIMRRNVRFSSENVFLSLDVPGVTDVEAAFATVNSVVRSNASRSSFLRYEMHEGVLHVTAEAELSAPESMPRITSQLRQHYPATNVSFYDESSLPTP